MFVWCADVATPRRLLPDFFHVQVRDSTFTLSTEGDGWRMCPRKHLEPIHRVLVTPRRPARRAPRGWVYSDARGDRTASVSFIARCE